MSEELFLEYAEKYPELYRIFEFYRGWFSGVCDTLTDSSIEDTHPGLNAMIDHVVMSIIADVIKIFIKEKVKR